MAATGACGSASGTRLRRSRSWSAGPAKRRAGGRITPEVVERMRTMAVVSLIEKRDQADVSEKILKLKHCGLWNPPASHAPPQAVGERFKLGQPVLDLSYVDTDEYLMAL